MSREIIINRINEVIATETAQAASSRALAAAGESVYTSGPRAGKVIKFSDEQIAAKLAIADDCDLIVEAAALVLDALNAASDAEFRQTNWMNFRTAPIHILRGLRAKGRSDWFMARVG